jgi:hypothetical protein
MREARLLRDRMSGFGSRTWYFPDGDRPPAAPGPAEPHEALMVLNVSRDPAHLLLDVYWTDRPPTLGLPVTVEAERVVSLRAPWSAVDADGEPFDIPVRTQYALRVRSDVPVICQYGRLEMVPSFALYTTMGLHDPEEA